VRQGENTADLDDKKAKLVDKMANSPRTRTVGPTLGTSIVAQVVADDLPLATLPRCLRPCVRAH
jgi:hypothetical protein